MFLGRLWNACFLKQRRNILIKYLFNKKAKKKAAYFLLIIFLCNTVICDMSLTYAAEATRTEETDASETAAESVGEMGEIDIEKEVVNDEPVLLTNTVSGPLTGIMPFEPSSIGSDKTSLLGKNNLEELVVNVIQDNKTIGEGDKIDSQKEFTFNFSFQIPVGFDDPNVGVDVNDDSTYMKSGDWAEFNIDNEVDIKIDVSNPVPIYNGSGSDKIHIADAIFSGGKVKIIFTDEINPDKEVHTVKVQASFECSFDDSGSPDAGGDEEVVIINKSFNVEVPAKEVKISGAKSGTIDTADDKFINWVVRVSAEAARPGSDNVSAGNLVGFTFTDILSKDIGDSVGDYVPDSLWIGLSNNKNDAVLVTSGVSYDNNTGELKYGFVEDTAGSGECLGTRYLFFQTEIKDEDYVTDKGKKLTNKAIVSNGDDITKNIQGNADVPKKTWITKEAKVENESSSTAFDPDKQYIKWTVTVNQGFGKIDNAKIEDAIPAGLTYVNDTGHDSKRYDWDDAAGDFSSSPSSISVSGSGSNVIFELGKITKPVKVEFYTKVNAGQGIEHTTKTYKNKAVLKGSIIPAGGFDAEVTSGPVGVASIIKKGNPYNSKDHSIHWDVTLDSKGQDYIDSNFRVLDLLVYGGEDSFSLADRTESFTSGGNDLRDVSNSVLKQVTPRFYQKFDRNSFSGAGLKPVFHELKDGDKVIAELMVVTTDAYGGIGNNKESKFSYKTIVTNPDYYASNASNKVYNSAGFFAGNTKIKDADASINIKSNMMNKTVMPAENANKVIIDGNDYTSVNTDGNDANSFNYNNKTVIYKLHVNANGLTDAAKDITTVDGGVMGAFTINDVLPPGWEFKELSASEKFWIYEGTANSDKVKADKKLSSVEYGFLKDGTALFTQATADKGEGITFQFDELKKPYLILLKAGPTEEKAKEYFSKNALGSSKYNIKNTAVLSNDNITVSTDDYEDISFESNILSKSFDSLTAANTDYMTWTVTYNPYHIGTSGNKITDTLPIGIDVRVNNNGELIFTDNDGNKNISLTAMNLKDDGTLEDGSEIELAGKGIVTYDSADRKLQLDIPDTAKAYKLSYITDIEGLKGKNFTNHVELSTIGGGNPVTANGSYSISYHTTGASLLRGGWIEIKKTDTDNNPLADAEFSLFSEDGTVPVKQGITYNDGILRMKTIYPGDYILAETKTPSGYVVSGQRYAVKVTYDSKNKKYITSINGKTGVDSNKIAVVNHKASTVGNLEISKTVAGNRLDTDKDKSFEFTVKFSNGAGAELTGEFPYIRKDDPSIPGGIIKSGDVIKLAHEEAIVICDLPGGTVCNVKERDYTLEDYITSISGLDADGNVTIEADQTKKAAFTNIKNMGGLVIQKRVEGNTGDREKKFEFTLTFQKTGGSSYPYYLNGATVQSGTVASGDSFQLAHSDFISIPDLPKGAVYKAEEKDYKAEGYKTSAMGTEGTIEEGSTKIALFTNTKDTGNLTISKEVIGNDGEKDKKFKFTVTLTDGMAVSYPYKGNGGALDGVLICNTENNIELAHGESISFSDLPAGTKYEVIEEDYSSEGYVTTKTDESGTIEMGKTSLASYCNSRNKGSLVISKRVEGNAGDTAKKFSFIVDFKDKDGKITNESYPYQAVFNNKLTDPATSMPAAGTVKSGDTIYLAHEESLAISGILEGTSYIVTEESVAKKGYSVEAEGDTGIITGMSAYEAAFINTKNEPESSDGGNHGGSSEGSGKNENAPAVDKKYETPEYETGKAPDPNNMNSPDKIVLVNRDGSIIDTYTKQENADGTFSYVNAKGEVLADSAITKTGDTMNAAGLIISGFLAIGAAIAIILLIIKKRRNGYYYD